MLPQVSFVVVINIHYLFLEKCLILFILDSFLPQTKPLSIVYKFIVSKGLKVKANYSKPSPKPVVICLWCYFMILENLL